MYVTTESRKPRDVRGQLLPLRFKVVDNRCGQLPWYCSGWRLWRGWDGGQAGCC